MKKKTKTNNIDPYSSINRRLDALIRVVVETLDDKKFKEGDVVRMLKSSGLTPTDIAKILGKKGRTSVTSHLYRKSKKQTTE